MLPPAWFCVWSVSRPLKKLHLPRSRLQIALDVLFKYASDDLKASALHLHLFERPEIVFFNTLLDH